MLTKKVFSFLLIFLISNSLLGQSLHLFDIDTTDFPTLRAKFYAADQDSKQIVDLSKDDFKLFEDGEVREILNIDCPPPKSPKAISSVLTIDISSSMSSGNLEIAKEAARAWINALPLGQSECAITAFDHKNYMIQDFTTDRKKLLDALDKLKVNGSTDFNAGFITPMAGGLQVLEEGKHEKVLVFITDGAGSGNKQEIVDKANSIDAAVYNVTLGSKSPIILQEIATETNGQWHERVTTIAEAKTIYTGILLNTLDLALCNIEWKSVPNCERLKVFSVNLQITNMMETIVSYKSPISKISELKFNPLVAAFEDPLVNTENTQQVTVTAQNSIFEVTDIISSNPAYDISPKNFILDPNESIELTVSYTPSDSNLTFNIFEFINTTCESKYYARGGWKGKRPATPTIKLENPNGGETLVVGSSTNIEWSGVLPNTIVSIDYSTDNGRTWYEIAEQTNGLNYQWDNVPPPASEQCIARVTQPNITDDGHSSSSPILWDKLLGGTSEDRAEDIIESSDGAYVVLGRSLSNDGDVSGSNGGWDYWVVKISPVDGNIIWEKSLGWIRGDEAYSIIESSDGNYVIGGMADLNDEQPWQKNFWVVKISSTDGSIIWEKSLIGGNRDYVYSMIEDTDGNYVVVGSTNWYHSNTWHQDLWVVKMSPTDGSIIWEDKFGGSNIELGYDIIESSDGNYIIVGTTRSDDGDVSGNNGDWDYWVIKISPDNGNIIWEKTLGGSKNDMAHSVIESTEGGYVIAGLTNSNDGDISEIYNSNLWVVKISPSDGSIIWEKTFEGSKIHFIKSIVQDSDGAFVIAVQATSSGGNSNLQVVKISPLDGSIIWKKTLGENKIYFTKSIIQSSDGAFVIAGSTIPKMENTYDIWVLKIIEPYPIQSDVSDAVFSIVMPETRANNINMGDVLVGKTKDLVVNEFMLNTGSWEYSVDSIYFEGADADAFRLVGGIPQYIVKGNDSHFGEFQFAPTQARQYQADIVIITQADTLFRTITGQGVSPILGLSSELLNFGEWEIGEESVLADTALITNISSTPIQIDNVIQLGPDSEQFEIISGGGAFNLGPGESHEMTLRFKPIYGGRTSGQLGFEYSGTGSPARVQLFGTGIGGEVYIENDSAYAGEPTTIKVMLGNIKPEGLAEFGPKYRVTVRFHSTLLGITGGHEFNISGDSTYVTIEGNLGSSNILAEIPVMAGLGIVEETAVDVVGISLVDEQGNNIEYDFEKQSGIFKLLGICHDGGTRLFDSNGISHITSITPNPAFEEISLDFEIIELGHTEIGVYNLLGERVAIIYSEDVSEPGFRQKTVSLKNFQIGQYIIRYTSPTYSENHMLIKVR